MLSPGQAHMMLLLLQSLRMCLLGQGEEIDKAGGHAMQGWVMVAFSGAQRATRMNDLGTAEQTTTGSGHSTHPLAQKPAWGQSRMSPHSHVWHRQRRTSLAHGQHRTSPVYSPRQGLCASTVIRASWGAAGE